MKEVPNVAYTKIMSFEIVLFFLGSISKLYNTSDQLIVWS